MGIAEILNSIDREIALLQQARALLNGGSVARSGKNGYRAKKGPVADLADLSIANPGTKKRKRRKLTPEGRRRIAEAVKRRWEKHRKATAKSTKSTAK